MSNPSPLVPCLPAEGTKTWRKTTFVSVLSQTPTFMSTKRKAVTISAYCAQIVSRIRTDFYFLVLSTKEVRSNVVISY